MLFLWISIKKVFVFISSDISSWSGTFGTFSIYSDNFNWLWTLWIGDESDTSIANTSGSSSLSFCDCPFTTRGLCSNITSLVSNFLILDLSLVFSASHLVFYSIICLNFAFLTSSSVICCLNNSSSDNMIDSKVAFKKNISRFFKTYFCTYEINLRPDLPKISRDLLYKFGRNFYYTTN